MSATFVQSIRRIFVLAAAVAAIATGGSEVLARAAIERASPADGHAEIVAQGLAILPSRNVVWRVVRRHAETRDDTVSSASSLGFVVADQSALLIESGDSGRRLRLAAGESAFVGDGEEQTRSSLAADAADYYALELVAEGELGDSDALFTSDSFRAPRGERDLDLVRDVLATDESTNLRSGDPVLVLATDGTLEITHESTPAILLESGEAALIDGDATIRNTSDSDGIFVAAIIGPEIPAVADRIVATRGPATEVPATEVAQTGSIAITVRLCPPGMLPETMVGDDCDLANGDWSLSLLLPSTGQLELDSASVTLSSATWSNLPLGLYGVVPTLPTGFDNLWFDTTLPVPSAGGWPIEIDAEHPDASNTVYFFQPALTPADSDGDGLLDVDEINIDGTDPNNPDTDGDGLSDGQELHEYGTNAFLVDSDGDTVNDFVEINGRGGWGPTDPNSADTDVDGASDGEELALGTIDPNNPDTDGDLLLDGAELHALTGWSTDPSRADTDEDTVSDGDEITRYFTSPVSPDGDGDGIDDDVEIFGLNGYSTIPTDDDTDNDGVIDGLEIAHGTNPLDATSH